MDTILPGDMWEGPDDMFTGGGEMGELMRAFDWASTVVGPVEQWSQSLRTTVGILLHSRHPMFLWWGPDLIQFYNDGYRPSLGVDKHPLALGQAGRECWGEIWPVIGFLVEGVLNRGESTWSEDQFIPITRNGYLEEVYWTYGYSPVFESNGQVGGVLVVCSETTGRVRAERRLRTLAGINGKAIEAKTTEAIAASAARLLADNPADLPFALLYFLTPAGNELQLVESVGIATDTPASPAFLDLAELLAHANEGWEIGYVMETGSASFVGDVATRFGALPGGPWNTPATSAFVLPIASPGEQRPIGILVAGISPGQVFDASYQQFLELVAAALATALTNVRAYQAAQERANALAELDRAKTAFFSNISHEFRTPLTLSLGPLEMLLSDTQHPLVPEQRTQVELIHRNALRQLKLVNTLLNFARIEAGRVDASYMPTNLAQLTRDLGSAFQSAIEKAGLQLIVECPPLPERVYVDQDMWEKIVLNLLSNAFKFTFEGFIRLALQPVEGGVALIVQDTGIGMHETDVSHLFERFYRAHSARARTREGSGIGLALVQELVRLHGGSIAVQSTEGVGTTFTIRLPLGSGHLPAELVRTGEAPAFTMQNSVPYVEEALYWLPASAPDAVSDCPVALPPAVPFSRVLVVDDNADMREYLKRLLSTSYQVLQAADGNMALALVRTARLDLIITDVMMPGLDGFALLKALRAEKATAAIPVILLSARAGEDAMLEGLQAGANDYLVKPFSAREALARVQAQLEIVRLRREAEHARQHLHELFMQAPAAICVLSGPQHVFELLNPLYQQLLGPREIVGKAVREALPELEGQGFYELLDRVYSTGEPFIGVELRAELARKLGGEREEAYFNFVYQPMLGVGDEVEGIMVHAVEVTEQVWVRQRMDTFLGIAGHELKNPLTSIKANVELSQRRVRKALEEMVHEEELQQTLESVSLMLKRATQQINFQNRLVSDLVDTTRIQAGKLELRSAPADLNSIVRDAVEEQRQLAPARVIQLDLVADGAQMVNVDADRIGQVITNYLSNALKYSEQNILVRVEPLDAEEVRVAVQDSGPGISKQEQERIWERFYRTPGSQVKRGSGIGLGLGLHICQTIIAEHGGHVGVDSVQGAGSTFWFTLPRAAR